MRSHVHLAVLAMISVHALAHADENKPPVYVWLEPEWFNGVQGSFAYWTGAAKPAGSWGIAGPGISAEWSQGGESEWNSIGVCAEETHAACHRELFVPRAGQYRVWVRYVDHRGKTEPFTVRVEQADKPAITGELGVRPVVPPNDEYQLYWGFSFGWGALDGRLDAGPAQLHLIVDKAGQAWRQVDAVLITDDPQFTPVGREKPPFAYLAAFKLQPKDGSAWRGSAKGLSVGAGWQRQKLAGHDFSMWTSIDTDAKWWGQQNIETLTRYDTLFQFAPPADIRDRFHQQFAGRKDVPVLAWPGLLPGIYLGTTPDLSPDSPVRKWLERTKTPFYTLTNYANPQYTDKTGPATYQALTGPLAGQFLGYIHGEAIGTGGVSLADKPLSNNRREHVDALGKNLLKQQAERWSQIYKTPVPESHWSKGISCLSVDSIALAHLFHELGSAVVGYEEDATNVHVPMRIAFERGAARQYAGAWINYASGNFGDACNYFTQNPVVNRGAGGWFHSKYAVTDGVSVGWYRKLYYLNYLGGASAIFWEQGLGNQWILPGPGTHPIQLSPFGRATEDFQAFVDRLPDRGEPLTPIAILLSYGHAYERVNYACKMLNVFAENAADLELRELFNVCWHPTAVLEGQPAAPDVQSMPGGVYGNIFDVLVDRPERAKAIMDYPIVWVAGDVELGSPSPPPPLPQGERGVPSTPLPLGEKGVPSTPLPLGEKGVPSTPLPLGERGRGEGSAWLPVLQDYLQRGGTLVVNVQSAKGKLPVELLGVRLTGERLPAEQWNPDGEPPLECTPYEVERVELAGAKPLAWAAPGVPLITRQQVGQGAVILTLVPRMLGRDERAHPALPFLMNGLTSQLLPVEVLLQNGQRPAGEIMYQLNRTKTGYLVTLVNNRGVDKTQNGVARVDRRAFTDVLLRTKLPVQSAKEYTQPRNLPVEKKGDHLEFRLRVHPGDVQVVGLQTAP